MSAHPVTSGAVIMYEAARESGLLHFGWPPWSEVLEYERLQWEAAFAEGLQAYWHAHEAQHKNSCPKCGQSYSAATTKCSPEDSMGPAYCETLGQFLEEVA